MIFKKFKMVKIINVDLKTFYKANVSVLKQ